MDTSIQQQNTQQPQMLNRVQQAPALGVQPGGISTPSQPTSGQREQEPVRTTSPQETVQQAQEQEQASTQEAGIPVALQPAEQAVEVKQSVPEVAVEQSLEAVVEKSPDVEKPIIAEELKKVGVTHSGPGVPVQENSFAVTQLPMNYQQAKIVDKQTTLKESKHWLAELVMYVWRKVDPTVEKSTDTKGVTTG